MNAPGWRRDDPLDDTDGTGIGLGRGTLRASVHARQACGNPELRSLWRSAIGRGHPDERALRWRFHFPGAARLGLLEPSGRSQALPGSGPLARQAADLLSGPAGVAAGNGLHRPQPVSPRALISSSPSTASSTTPSWRLAAKTWPPGTSSPTGARPIPIAWASIEPSRTAISPFTSSRPTLRRRSRRDALQPTPLLQDRETVSADDVTAGEPRLYEQRRCLIKAPGHILAFVIACRSRRRR
jgi:hypothetical protein